MKKHISFILAAAMLLSLFTFVSCDEQAVNDVLDAALAVVEALPDAEDSGDDTENTESEDPETGSQTADTPEQENSGNVPPETDAAETDAPEAEAEEPAVPEAAEKTAETEKAVTAVIDENGWYDDKENVALYIHTYGKLPKNYVSKNDAEALYGWEGGALDQYAEGMAIGGSKFGNYEGLLPKKNGRQYYECDIDTVGTTSRGAARIVYSNDGLIYYTDDHYETFELLYGEE